MSNEVLDQLLSTIELSNTTIAATQARNVQLTAELVHLKAEYETLIDHSRNVVALHAATKVTHGFITQLADLIAAKDSSCPNSSYSST